MNTGFFPILQVIKNNRTWILLSLVIFGLGFFSFLTSYQAMPHAYVDEFNQEAFAFLEYIVEFITQSHPLIGTLLIFINNVISSFQMLFLGVILGLSPLFTLLLNGGMLGTISMQIFEQGTSIWFLLAGILPHGIPELAAFFLCSSFGLKLGYHTIVKPLPNKNRGESFKFIWKEIISVLPLVVVLLFIAAFIEIYFTQSLLETLF